MGQGIQCTVCLLSQDLDQRVEFSRSFREANINGLHLLELTSAEMTGGKDILEQYTPLINYADVCRSWSEVCVSPAKDSQPH